MLSRRVFVGALAAAAIPVPSWAMTGQPVALSAARNAGGDYVLVGLKADGSIVFSIPLPDRGHAGAAHPQAAEAVVVSRRPGQFALVVDCARGQVAHVLASPTGRHFYGHAAFSDDGHLLYTTENDIASGQGRIGVWDRRLGYQRIDEFDSKGIGPHEIIRLRSGKLAVANGGIRTHPDRGREKLNLATMQPNLSILSPTGGLVDQVVPVEAKNSLRHIAGNEAGDVFAGFQWQGDPFEAPDLVGVYRSGVFEMIGSDEASRLLDGYVGSVAAHDKGGVAVTSPRGGRLAVFDGQGAERFAAAAVDICGLVQTRSGTFATDGLGRVYVLEPENLVLRARHELAFDNHMVAVDQT